MRVGHCGAGDPGRRASCDAHHGRRGRALGPGEARSRPVASYLVDKLRPQAENSAMRRALKLVLVMAILLGIFGQTVAVAARPGAAVKNQRTGARNKPTDFLGLMQRNGTRSLPLGHMKLALP